jgi:hypothetical protein
MYRYLVLFGSGSALYIQKRLLSMITTDFCKVTYQLNVAETREVCSNLTTSRLYTLLSVTVDKELSSPFIQVSSVSLTHLHNWFSVFYNMQGVNQGVTHKM